MSSEKKPTANFNDVLAAINAVNKQTGYPIWIPSLGKAVMFSDITTGQQKEMIRALVDNPVYRTNFILALYLIIKNNCQETIDVDALTILDKVAIAIQLRTKFIGNTVTVETDDDDRKTVDLICTPSEKFVVPASLQASQQYDHAGITLYLRVPTIGREKQLEVELRSKLKNASIENYEDVRNVLADAYMGELAKYAEAVIVNGNRFELSQLGFSQVFNLVETLPSQLVRKAVAFLEETQTVIAAMTTFNGVPITLDAAFFAGK